MQPYEYLKQVAARLDAITTREEIHQILDELEFLYEAIDPEFQDLATTLIEELSARLKRLA